MLQRFILAIVFNILTCHANGNISSSYAKISTLGSHNHEGSPQLASNPKIYKSLNPTLDIPTLMVATKEDIIPDQSSGLFSGRAYPSFYSDSYRGSSNGRKNPVIYSQYKPYYRHYAMDRYTPGEAVASAHFKKNKEPYNYSPPRMKPTKASAISYTPPKDLYAFPPNLESNYMPPSKTYEEKPKKPITSYIPPPAGLPSLGFLGPVNPEYLPPTIQLDQPESNAEMSDQQQPKVAMPSGDSSDDMLPSLANDNSPSDGKEPPSGKDTEPTNGNDSQMIKGQIEQDMLPNIDSLQMPVVDEQPPTMDDDAVSDVDIPDDMFHYHNGHSSYGTHGIDAYPEIFYDGPDHDPHHMLHHPPEMITTTTTMKPEPPPEPRVKKYSYFYLGRKLWYIPLYFTVWFSFYIFWLIIKSIARHKVNLPNHYTGRMVKRAMINNSSYEQASDDIDNLTATVLNYIDQFQLRHVNNK